MILSVRSLRVGVLACACALAVGCYANPAPTFEAGADNSLPVPSELSKPGSQVKVVLPFADHPILVWRTEIGFGASAIKCTYCGMEVQYNSKEGCLECLNMGCRYKLDGSVLKGPTVKPLRAFVVDLQGERLRILG